MTVCIVAGGEATRLPGKLFLDVGGVPMLKRVFDNVSPIGEVVVSTSTALRESVARLLPGTRLIVDKSSGEGPLRALADAFAEISGRWVFVVSGDAPFVDSLVFARLAEGREAGDEAVVPVHDTVDGEEGDTCSSRTEPLAALYEREAFGRAASERLLGGRRSMHSVFDLLSVRFVPFADSRPFSNVNTIEEYEVLRVTGRLSEHGTGADSELEVPVLGVPGRGDGVRSKTV